MTNPGDSDEWWKQYGGAGVSPESGAQPPAAGAYEYPSSPSTPEPLTQYPSQPAPQPPQPQYPNYQQLQHQQPYPQGGYYGPQQPAGYQPYGPYQQSTNGMAIGALCCSLVSLATCGITAIVGIILGIVALGQINKTGQSGRGMALAGIWVGVGMIVLAVAYIVFLVVVAAGA